MLTMFLQMLWKIQLMLILIMTYKVNKQVTLEKLVNALVLGIILYQKVKGQSVFTVIRHMLLKVIHMEPQISINTIRNVLRIQTG